MLLNLVDAPVHSFQAALLKSLDYWNRTLRTPLKNVFWPHIFVGDSFQILDILQYASGLKLSPAAILSQNPIFEMDSSSTFLTI